MTIHVTLLHNPRAGLVQNSKENLLSALQDKGYTTTYVDIKKEKYAQSLQNPGDLVVIAGGDGTIRKVARHILGRGIPIGLLPMGTANNIATSFGISGKEPAEIINDWDFSSRKHFSLGLVNGPDGEDFFLESAGFGLFQQLITQHENLMIKETKSKREDELEKALKIQQKIVSGYNARTCTLNLDGQVLSGRYILVEAMNIGLAGPNMDLAPQATSADDFLDVVLVKEDEREKFDKYLANRIKGKANRHLLAVRRARKIKIEWHGTHYHLDDKVHETNSPIQMDIRVMPKGLEFLS